MIHRKQRRRSSVIFPSHRLGACLNGKTTELYKRWQGIKGRCLRPSHTSYPKYGAVGITVCDEWLRFEPFRDWSESHGFQPDLVIDRIDNSKGYFPENCRWVTPRQNTSNRHCSVIFPSGETTREVAGRLNMTPAAILLRLEAGWSKEKTMTQPRRKLRPMNAGPSVASYG
jgi:hypothetical protein